MQKTHLLYRGKVKSLFKTDKPGYLIAQFHDDMTAFDGKKHQELANKGAINNLISTFIMKKLSDAGIATHYVKTLAPCETLVKQLTMIPLECVIRNIASGSLCRRLGIANMHPLNPPLYELFLKNDALHDPIISEHHALAFEWATREQLDEMQDNSFAINRLLTQLFDDADLLLVDSKYEFGIDTEQKLCLGDEISPDSCRIWDKKTREPLDKDRFRKEMGSVIESYKEIANRFGLEIAEA